MRQQLDALAIPFVFFDAIDGTEGKDPLLKKYHHNRRMMIKGYPMKAGEVACFASHYALWCWSVDHDRAIVVLEDDLEINARLRDLLPELSKLLKHHTFIRLARLKDGKKINLSAEDEIFKTFKYKFKARGTQGYVITPTAAKKMISHASYFYLPVDDYIDSEWLHGVPAIGIEPALIQHADMTSEIGVGRKEKAKLRYKPLREFYRVMDFLLSFSFHHMFMLKHKRSVS